MPTLASRVSSTGSSKATPNAKMSFITRSISLTFASSWIGNPPAPVGVSKLRKNRQAIGNTK